MTRRAAGLIATPLWLLLTCTSSIALVNLSRLPAGAVHGPDTTGPENPPVGSTSSEPAERLNFRTYTPADGLPATETADIEGDREGFVWFASMGGLAKFDGRTFTRYPTDPLDPLAMPQFAISDLAPDPIGGMWAAAGILVHVDSVTGAITRTDVAAELIDTADTAIWVWTPDEVKQFDPGTGKVVTTIDLRALGPDDERIGLVALSDKRAIVGATGGAWLVDDSGRATEIELADEPEGVLAVTPRAAGGAWLVGQRALYLLDPLAEAAVKVVDLAPIQLDQPFLSTRNGLIERSDHSVWISRDRHGVDVYDPGSGATHQLPARTAPGGVGALAISEFYEDHQGGLWLSVVGLGVQYLAPGLPAVWTSTPPLSPTEPGFAPFLDMELVGDDLWVASDGRGLHRYDTVSGKWSAPIRASAEGIPSDNVIGLAAAPGELWLGTWGGGIARLDLRSFEVTRLPDESVAGPNILDVVEGPDDTFWASVSGHGVQVFDSDAAPLMLIGPGGDIEADGTQYLAVAFESEHIVWLGGSSGIERVDIERGLVTGRWNNESGHLLGDVVFDLVVAPGGRVWAGTSAGLERLSPGTGTTRHFGSIDGVPGPMVLQVEPQVGRDVLWLGTSMALAEFDLSTERVIQAYAQRDGVPVGGFSRSGHARLRNGIDVFSTSWGLTFGRVVPPPSFSPPVFLTSVRADGQTHRVGLDTTLRLDDSTNQIAFAFSAVDFQRADELTFEYRLVGVSNTWQARNAKASVTYSNLSPDRYRFEVRARSASGRYSSTVASVTVIVEPAWWETRLARFGSGIAIIAVLGLATLAWARSGRRRQHQLEWLVAQRTAALTDQTERAKAANDAKTRFLSNISHELRNPLHSVLGFAELIRRQESAVDRHGHWADCIYASGSDLLGMIEELLELSSLQSAPPSLQVAVMQLGSALSSTAEAVSLMPGGSDKDFCVVVDVADDAVLCDARRLRQVLANLLANAVRYSTGHRIELSVLQRPAAAVDVGRYRFAVRDEGPGMSAEEAEQIFEPFIRGSRARGAGAGLGLSISQQLVNRLGGKLSVDTEPGTPSEFWFELDLAIVSLGSAETTIDLRADVPAAGAVYRRALIVDDDATARQMVADSLAMLGVQTLAAATAEEAVLAAESFRPDILFVDHSMPGLNGSDTAEAVRAVLAAAEAAGPKAPSGPFVVAVTGQLEQARAESKGAYDCYLQKPVRLAELAAAVRRDSEEPVVR